MIMTNFASNAIFRLSELTDEYADENVRQWFLMNSPIVVPILIPIIYYTTVCHIGPKMMQNREPFNISNVILAYNFVQIALNGYLCVELIHYTNSLPSPLLCFRLEHPKNQNFYSVKRIQWIIFISRLLDLLDTVFFVLRKKQSHVSFLHVYHHALVLIGSWYCTNFVHGGMILFFALINTFVHTIMYSYYTLAATSFSKGIASYLKRPITQLQIAQFIICGIHLVYSLHNESCSNYNVYLIYFGASQLIVMIILFSHFYRRTYKKQKIAANRQQHKIQNQNGIGEAKIKST